jgi:PBP1b-binding outer membrane lipoprotein LpoB
MDRMKALALILALALVALSLLSRFTDSRPAAEPAVAKHAAEQTDSHETAKDDEKIKADEPIDLTVKQELRKEFTLKPNVVVYVSGINGKLDVTTSDTDKAEIYLVRSVRKAEDFEERKVNIGLGENDSLEIEIRKNRSSSIWGALNSRNEERQRLELKLPRNVVFQANNNTGNITVGELDNALLIEGLNGNVKAARVMNRGVFEDINGNVDATFAKLTKGLALQGVNGNLDFRFADAVNADIGIRRHSGQVNNELPNVTVTETKHGRYEARVGEGGFSIEGNYINGNFNLLTAAKMASK